MGLLDRDAALGDLEMALADAVRGAGRVVLVRGEAGIGKTALVEHFVAQARPGVRVLWGGCHALLTPRPLGPLHDIAQQVGARRPALPESSHRPHLRGPPADLQG